MSTATPSPARARRNLSAHIAEAIRLEMDADEAIIVLGEDVGAMGGVFGSTRGLQKRHGEWRVRDTPISEMGFTGMAVGLALAGKRPLVEVMFVDFLGVCLEQIYNAMAKNRYMSGGRVEMPIVVKTAAGCIGSAAQHSQCLWGTFAHLPGLRVVVPSNPYDARGMMAAALQSPDPVVYVEHKGLLLQRGQDFRTGLDVPEGRYVAPLDGARVVREGGDLTLATLGAGVQLALEVADALAQDGVETEVVDLRSVVPLDAATVAASAARTGRLLVVDEDYLSFGLSAELITRVLETATDAAPPAFARHAVADVPIPAARSLEEAVLPDTASILAAAHTLLARTGR